MNNLTVREGKAVSGSRCTMCYRCFSHCPAQALTIIGKRVHEQCTLEGYRD
jgi:ferredoxin